MSADSPTAAAADALQAIIDAPAKTLVGLDFDGTLAPIIDNPDAAYADPDAVRALARLGGLVGSVVIITGRPVRTAVRLGRFAGVAGLESMVVIGQYGVERWDAATDTYLVPPEPTAIAELEAELPTILSDLDLEQATIEHKGRAIGVHTRTLPDPSSAFQRLAEPLKDLAERVKLKIERGKNVWEIRPHGVDKGAALRDFLAESKAEAVIFAGDDLGDLAAFEAVRELRADGLPGLLVCSASHEEDALTAISDVIVDGPPGIAIWLNELADRIESASAH